MSTHRSFGEKVKHAVENVKEKLTGHSDNHSIESHNIDYGHCHHHHHERPGEINLYGSQCCETGRRFEINCEPEVVVSETCQPYIRDEVSYQPTIYGIEVREPGPFTLETRDQYNDPIFELTKRRNDLV